MEALMKQLVFAVLVVQACTSAAAQPRSTVAPRADTSRAGSADAARMVAYARAHANEATALLERLVNVNSGTMNPDGVREVGRILRGEMDALGFSTRWIDLPETKRAGHLFAERRGNRGKRLLLIGHLDTVFEKDSPFQKFVREGNVAKGALRTSREATSSCSTRSRQCETPVRSRARPSSPRLRATKKAPGSRSKYRGET
jgi:hypothetical protein